MLILETELNKISEEAQKILTYLAEEISKISSV